MGLLDHKLALVTGGGSGIGAATCRRMAQEGATVAVVDRDEASARAVAKDVGGPAFVCDVSDHSQVADAVAKAADALGGLSLVFANAGTGTMAAVGEMDPDEWRKIIDVNLSGEFHPVRECVPHLVRGGGGSVFCTSSISGVRPAEGESAYSAAKAGVAAFCANVALEYAPVVR